MNILFTFEGFRAFKYGAYFIVWLLTCQDMRSFWNAIFYLLCSVTLPVKSIIERIDITQNISPGTTIYVLRSSYILSLNIFFSVILISTTLITYFATYSFNHDTPDGATVVWLGRGFWLATSGALLTLKSLVCTCCYIFMTRRHMNGYETLA